MERILKILITGGNGYIGRNIGLHLSSIDEFQVTIAKRVNSKITLSDQKKINILEIDYNSSSSLKKIISGFDIIIHCAGMDSKSCESNPNSAFEFNSLKTEKIAKIANELNVKKIINFSTAHVYKDKLSGIINESNPILNEHPYARSNHEAERLLNEINIKNKLQCISLRLSNVIGSPIDKECKSWNLLMNDISKQIFLDGFIKLKSDGLQRRNFVTMSDLKRLILHLIYYDFSKEKFPIYNIGGNWNPTVYEAAIYLKKIYSNLFIDKKDIKILKLNPDHIENKENLIYDNNKICSIGYVFENNYDLEIKNLLLYCKKLFKK